MRLSPLFAALGLLLATSACQDGSSMVPAVREAPTRVAPSYGAMSGSEMLAAAFDITIDPETFTAEVALIPGRRGQTQPPQNLSYDLDIERFLARESFEIKEISVDGDGNFEIGFHHAHPFPAPILTNPVSGLNRADLGYTGRVLFLTAGSPSVFPATGGVRVDAVTIMDADGYLDPGGLLDALDGDSLYTVLPYKLLVDEALDNRNEVSNAGDPAGNYEPAAGGWQASNIDNGGVNNGWKGYDYLHQGQSCANEFTVRKEALAAQGFQLQVAILIKYTDPRGTTAKANRLPATPFDVHQFAYRLPHAALDVSQVKTGDDLEIGPNVGNNSPIAVDVRDWDAFAVEAPDLNLGESGNVSLIANGTGGAPQLWLEIPGVITGQLNLGSPTGTGIPGDELNYAALIFNTETNAPPGPQYGLLVAIDAGSAEDLSTILFGIDPSDFTPDAGLALQEYTFQVVPVTVTAPPVVTAVEPHGVVGLVSDPIQFRFEAEGSVTSAAWDFGGGTIPNESTLQGATVTLGPAPGFYTGTVTVTGPTGTSEPFEFDYRVFPLTPPSWVYTRINLTQDTYYPSLIPYAGGLALVYYSYIDEDLQVSISADPNPRSQGDWRTISVREVGTVSTIATLLDVAGRLMIIHRQPATYDVGVAIAELANVTSTADFTTYDIVPPEDLVFSEATVVNGKPVFVGRIPDIPGKVYFASSAQQWPFAPPDWALHAIDPSATSVGLPTVVAQEGRPVILHSDSGEVMRITLGTTATPASNADWRSYTLGDDTDVLVPSMAVRNRRLGFVYIEADGDRYHLHLARTQTIDPLDASVWEFHRIDTTEGIYSEAVLTVQDNRFAVGYALAGPSVEPQRAMVARALVSTPSDASHWDPVVVNQEDFESARLIAFTPVDDHFAMAFFTPSLTGFGMQVGVSTAPW